MAKYYRRRRYYRKGKFQIENKPIGFTSPTTLENGFYQNSQIVVPASPQEGVRQVARMTITLTGSPDTAGSVAWALIYLPEGTQYTTSLFPTNDTLYEPSSYVLASGISDSTAGPIRISSRLKKNLNAGDRIALLTAATGSGSKYIGLLRYAIKYN